MPVLLTRGRVSSAAVAAARHRPHPRLHLRPTRTRRAYRGSGGRESRAAECAEPDEAARMKTRKLSGGYKMEPIKKKYPNHTEIAYREAVSKLKYLLAESYAPKMTIQKPLLTSKRLCKESAPDDYAEEMNDAQSVLSDLSKKEPSTRGKYYATRLSHFPQSQVFSVAGAERVAVPPAELNSYIERQEEYIEQLERESQYCREELKNLVDKVREVIAENEALQDKNKTGFFKSVLDSYPKSDASSPDDAPRTSRKSTLSGPSIVFESRISELEAQLTQARLELRKAREESQENLERLAGRRDEAQLHAELERALREKRELEARAEELQRELAKIKARDADVEAKSKRALEVAQQAEFDRSQAEAEVRRLKDELERRQEKLRDALQETNRRVLEEKQQVERRFSQQMEQLSADVACHWEAASKSHLESEKQRREIADLKRDLAQKVAFIDDLKKELQQKTAKLQEELNQAIAEKDASQEEISTMKLSIERNERQSRQEQSRLQAEINSYKMRLERADADLVHARRENLRLAEQISALEKEINMNKIVEETRVGVQPPKLDKGKEEKDKDKELASLIYDLENKQAKTVAGLEDTLSKQASLVSRLTAECQSLTQRLEANDQKHKKEMANLQSNIDFLSSKMRESFDSRERNAGKTSSLGKEQNSGLLTNSHQESENNIPVEKYNSQELSRHGSSDKTQDEIVSDVNYPNRTAEDENLHPTYPEIQQQPNYEDDYSSQHYSQYNQYDPNQYQEYFTDQPYNVKDQEYSEDQQYSENKQYLENETYKDEPYTEQDYKNYSNKHEEKIA